MPSIRRNLINQFRPVMRRKGLTASVISRKTSVSMPVVRVTNSSGFAPTCLRHTSQSKSPSGTRLLIARRSFAKRVSFISGRADILPANLEGRLEACAPRSVIHSQIHPGVQMRDLFSVTIEQERLACAELADSTLVTLTPTRMADARIYVRIEAVLVRSLNVPSRGRLIGDQSNLHNRLNALEPVFPRDNQANRRAILRRQRLAVQAGSQNRQRMYGFVEPQPLNVRPIEDARVLIWHASGI